ncbi:MAG: DUF1704 domain-containing protein [Myxococcales bacterium]|nr:DUF1704 domain-containing protein [Myxococcales bacterium]
MDRDLAPFAALDARLVEVAREIKILSALAWPPEPLQDFLAAWRAGNPRLPRYTPVPRVNGDAIDELRRVMTACDREHPIGRFLYRSARSYLLAAEMIASLGTPAFTERSRELYGAPLDELGAARVTNLAAAEHFLNRTRDLIETSYIADEAYVIGAEAVAETLRARIDPVFVDHKIEVVIDPTMASKAAAGSRRVRLRASTGFTPNDVAQLLEHEIFVHSVTALNGREQPQIKCLGLGAPRTTAVQEGLATFAEMITNSMDLARLRRLALRVVAVQMALDGADFIDLFRFFHSEGQNLDESFHSAMRVFRGGDVGGRIAFTKDIVYLPGLIQVHAFLLKACQRNRPELIHHLFAGRMTLGDALELDPWFRSGALSGPLYEPPWVNNRASLTAFLIYSAFNTRFELGEITLDDFREAIDDER